MFIKRGPLRRVPPLVQWAVSERDGSHTGEVGLCWGLVEQDRHEHLSDGYESRYIIMVPPYPSLVKVRDSTVGSQQTKKRGEPSGKALASQMRIMTKPRKLS